MAKLPFSFEESTKTNVLISGANASGKTRLACSIASKLHKLGHVVKVVDISGVWRTLSDLPLFVLPTITDNQIKLSTLDKNASGIYDLSTLKLSQVKQVVDALSLQIWNERINQPKDKQTYLIIEESEAFLKNIRSKESENLFRLVHVGRNIDVRCILITTDLALLDASVIRLCGLRFHGFLTPEENSKRKFRAYYGKDWLRIALEALEAGTFIYFDQSNHKQPLQVKSYPEYKPTHKARQFYRLPKPKQQTIKATHKPSTTQTLMEIISLPLRWLDPLAPYTSVDINQMNESLEDEQEEEEDYILLEC